MIKLLPQHTQIICRHAQITYPQECCGLLLGKTGQESKLVKEVWETENSWTPEAATSFAQITNSPVREATKRHNFTIAPEAMLQAQKYAYKHQLAIVGIYHSHPDYPAVPSEFDRAIAWQQYSYIIVSISPNKINNLRSWVLNEQHQFEEEAIIA